MQEDYRKRIDGSGLSPTAKRFSPILLRSSPTKRDCCVVQLNLRLILAFLLN